MNQTITIDEMQDEVETLRNALARLAVFVGGNPCWCNSDGGKHSKACRDTLQLRLWPRAVAGRTGFHDRFPWKDAKPEKGWQMKTPEVLNRIADVVLNYRPKDKRKKPRKRKRPKKAKKNA